MSLILARLAVALMAEGIQSYNDALLATCRSQGAECVDVAARLPKNQSIFWDDAHFTAEGARQIAEILAAFLLERDPLASLASQSR